MLGKEGYQPYMDFINGEGSEDAVRSAFESLAEIHENHISDDAASLNLTTSMENIINGDAAFIHQGNWAAGAFRNAEDFAYDEDWGYVPFPGTGNMYTLHFDSFLYPGNNPSPENSRKWLSFVGKETAQVAYNQYKGSIPTLADIELGDEFGPYLQEAAQQFADAEHRPPTLQHGLAVTGSKMTALNDVISSEFTGPYNVDGATSGFMDAI
jgi:glucose/mannose transport system substrate-binding protein